MEQSVLSLTVFLHEAQVKNTILALEVPLLVPLDDNVFELADPVQIAIDLLRTVNEEESLCPVFIVVECCYFRCFLEGRRLPLYPLHQSIHIGNSD